MKSFFSELSYLWALNSMNLKTYAADWKRIAVMSFFMFVQDIMFFALWVIFFDNISDLKGWRLSDVARMFGLIACSVGVSLFLFNGTRSLAFRIHEGTLDSFMTKPRRALPMLLMSSSSPASLGDIFFGPALIAAFGDVTWSMVPALAALIVISAIVFTSITLMIFSICFWLKSSARFPGQLFEMFIILCCNIQHGQPWAVQLVMYTVLPAAFTTFLPVQILRNPNPVLIGLLLAGTVFYALLARAVFYAGLRRYTA